MPGAHPQPQWDADEHEELAIGISGLPTMVGFHNQEEFIRTEGFNQPKLEKIFQDAIDTTEKNEEEKKE